jgi:hypothetical protein
LIVVVVVIVLIAIPLVLAIMWLGILTDVIEEETEKVTIQMASPSLTQRMITDQVHWDADLEINKVTPDLALVTYSDIRVIVKDSSGSVLIPSTKPLADDPDDYDDGSDGTVDVQVWYDSITSTTIMFEGDSFYLTGLTDTDYEGALVEIWHNDRRIGSTTLPTNFP